MTNLDIAFIVVIVLALGYLVITIMTYMKYVEVTEPEIKRMRQDGDRFEESSSAEEELARDVRRQVDAEQMRITELKVELNQARKSLQEAMAREKKLEMAQRKREG